MFDGDSEPFPIKNSRQMTSRQVKFNCVSTPFLFIPDFSFFFLKRFCCDISLFIVFNSNKNWCLCVGGCVFVLLFRPKTFTHCIIQDLIYYT